MSRHKPALFAMILLAITAWGVAGLGAVSAGARSPEAKIHPRYPESAQGLKQELKDMREVARKGRPDQLRAMVVNLEIPDDRTWYLANFGTSGLEIAEHYEKNLTASEKRLENKMIEFAREDGYFSVKKQNAKKAYPSLVTTPEVFLAAWGRIASGEYPDETPLGYFFFVDGKFRWDSTIMWVTVD